VYYPIIGSREKLVPPPFCFENVAKLRHVGTELLHCDEIRYSHDPDLLQTLWGRPPKDQPPSCQWPGDASPELVHCSFEGVLVVEDHHRELRDWLEKREVTASGSTPAAGEQNVSSHLGWQRVWPIADQ
jgi:hypothetical protein